LNFKKNYSITGARYLFGGNSILLCFVDNELILGKKTIFSSIGKIVCKSVHLSSSDAENN